MQARNNTAKISLTIINFDKLLERINNRKNKVKLMFPILMLGRNAASALSEGTLSFYDAKIMKKAMFELFVFEDYFLQLETLKCIYPEENPQINSAIEEIEIILVELERISGTNKYNLPIDRQYLKVKHLAKANYNLIDAAKANDNEGVEAAILAGANANFEYLGDYALSIAVSKKNHTMVRMLIEAGANVDIISGPGIQDTPLLIAVDNNDIEMVKLLIERGAYINKLGNPNLSSPLYIACDRSYVSCKLLELLLSTPGINPNEEIFGQRCKTALSAALRSRDYVDDDKIKCLLKAGVVIKDCDFLSALNNKNAVKLLLEAGYSCTKRSLVMAITSDKADIIDLILSRCDEACVEEAKREMNACTYSDLMFYVSLGQIEEIKKLLAQPSINLETYNFDGDTALLLAVKLGRMEITQLLLAAGAAVDAQEHRNDVTPLMIAAKSGNTKLIQLLLKHGADVNKFNVRYPKGETALLVATKANHAEVVEVLLTLDNIDFRIKTEKHESALELGLRSANKRIVDAYRLKLAKPQIAELKAEIKKEILHFKAEGKLILNIGNNKKAEKIEQALERANKIEHFSLRDFLNYKEEGKESISDALAYKRIGFFGDSTSAQRVNEFLHHYDTTKNAL